MHNTKHGTLEPFLPMINLLMTIAFKQEKERWREGRTLPFFYSGIQKTVVPFYIQVKKKEGWCPSTFNRCRERWREGPTLPGSLNCSPILRPGEEEGRAGPSLHLNSGIQTPYL